MLKNKSFKLTAYQPWDWIMKSLVAIFLVVFIFDTAYSDVHQVSTVSEFREALENAALNNEDDTIVLQPGVYETTSDGLGVFTFSDIEQYGLILTGNIENGGSVILDGGSQDRVFQFNNNEINSKLEMRNIIVRNGSINSELDSAGGVLANARNIIIRNSFFENNKAGWSGGALEVEDSDWVSIINSTFTNNSASFLFGGAVNIDASINSIIVNSTFSSNYSPSYGAGVRVQRAIIVNSTFDNHEGNALYVSSGNSLLVNNIFSNNLNDLSAGVSSEVRVYNNYIDYSKTTCYPTDCILIRKNNLQPATDGDVLFAGDSLRLSSLSPAINHGLHKNSSDFKELLTKTISYFSYAIVSETFNVMDSYLLYDKSGLIRKLRNLVDLGAFEFDIPESKELHGYACNVINNPESLSRRWGINLYDFSLDPEFNTREVYSVAKNRKIQSIACYNNGESVLISMRESVSGDFEIYKLDTVSGSLEQLTNNNTDDVDITSSFDGKMIAWQKRLPDGRQAIELLQKNQFGEYDYKTLASSKPFVQPSLSHNGNWLSFIQLRDNFFSILRYDIINNKYAEVKSIARRKKLYHPSISNDGNKVGWIERKSNKHYRIKELSSGIIESVLNDDNGIEHAVLSSDGSNVIYSINSKDYAQTYMIGLDNGKNQLLSEQRSWPFRYMANNLIESTEELYPKFSKEKLIGKNLASYSSERTILLHENGEGQYRLNSGGKIYEFEINWQTTTDNQGLVITILNNIYGYPLDKIELSLLDSDEYTYVVSSVDSYNDQIVTQSTYSFISTDLASEE